MYFNVWNIIKIKMSVVKYKTKRNYDCYIHTQISVECDI